LADFDFTLLEVFGALSTLFTRWDLNQTHCLTSELERVRENWLAKPSHEKIIDNGTPDVIDDDDTLVASMRGGSISFKKSKCSEEGSKLNL
jgi:hypothetical protein